MTGPETLYLKVKPQHPQPEIIAQAAALLRAGGLVAFPTETVYGLGADTFNSGAVTRIFTAKGRPGDNPLIVHVADLDQVRELVAAIPASVEKLAQHFWPGPLTVVLPHNGSIPGEVTAGLSTVAVRVPDHPVALALIRATGPIAAPSANLSGRPSPTMAQHVWDDLHGRIEAVLDGGRTGVGLESTVLDLSGELPLMLRPGGVSREELAQVIGEVRLDPALINPESGERPRSPGMKYRHYAPRGDFYLFAGELPDIVAAINRMVAVYQGQGHKVAVLATNETAAKYLQAGLTMVLGSRSNIPEVAANLFGALRACDREEATVILAETFPETGIGLALMNRLRKASGRPEVKVGAFLEEKSEVRS